MIQWGVGVVIVVEGRVGDEAFGSMFKNKIFIRACGPTWDCELM